MSELSDAVFGGKKPALKVPRGTKPATKMYGWGDVNKPIPLHMQQSLLQSTPLGRKALDLLLRGGQAGQAANLRGPQAGLQTLLHSESPQQATSDFETNRANFLTGASALTGHAQRGEDIYKNLGKIPVAGHAIQGTVDAFLGAGLDPTTAIGLSKAPAKLATMWDEHALPTVMRAGAKLERRAGPTIPRTLESLHNVMDVDAETKRAMAAQYGPGWYEQYAQAWGARTAAGSQRNLILNALQKEHKRIFDGLSENEGLLLRRAVNNGTVTRLEKKYPALARRAQAYEQWTDAVAHLRGSKALQQQLEKEPLNLFRYQNEPGKPQFSPGRTGTFFSIGKPQSGPLKDAYDRRGQYIDVGGPHLVTDRYIPNKPLTLPDQRGSVGAAILKRFIGNRADTIIASARRIASGESKSVEDADLFARELGINPDGMDVTDWERSINHETGASFNGILDRLGNEVARQRGYDAVIMRGSHLGGSDQFVKLYPHGKSPAELAGTSMGGFKMPEWAKPFTSDKPRGLQRTDQYLPNYVPALHNFTAEERAADPAIQRAILAAQERKLSRVNLMKTSSANLKHRAGPMKITAEGLPETQEAEQAFMRSAARNISAKDLERRIAPQFAKGGRFKNLPPYMKQYLNPKIDPVRSAVEDNFPALNRALSATQLGKAGLFYSPFPHSRNIAFMQLLADPGAIPATLANFARMRGGFISPEARAQVLKEPIHAGAVGAENLEAAQTAAAGRSLLKAIPKGELRDAASLVTKPVSALYGASNKALWAFDDAAKTALMKRNVKRGMSPERGALESNLSLVNYNEASPFTQGARYAFPFATWRTKMPFAVGRSVVRNPQNAAVLARLDPRLTGGQGPPAPWQDQKKKSALTTPLGEVLGGMDDPLSYGRGSLTTTARILANFPANAIVRAANKGPMIEPGMPGSKLNYFTYGQNALPYAEQQLPYIGQAMDIAGKGTFTKKPGQALGENLTGLREVFPKRDKASTEELRGKLFDAWQAKHPNADFKRVNYVKAYINYLRGAKLVEDLKALGVQP